MGKLRTVCPALTGLPLPYPEPQALALKPSLAKRPASASRGELRGRLLVAPVVGVPGLGYSIDVRTAWLDSVVTSGLDAGATQVVVIAAGA